MFLVVVVITTWQRQVNLQLPIFVLLAIIQSGYKKALLGKENLFSQNIRTYVC